VAKAFRGWGWAEYAWSIAGATLADTCGIPSYPQESPVRYWYGTGTVLAGFQSHSVPKCAELQATFGLSRFIRHPSRARAH
jgi:hypothetical protein